MRTTASAPASALAFLCRAERLAGTGTSVRVRGWLSQPMALTEVSSAAADTPFLERGGLICWHQGDLLWHRLGMLRRLRRRRAETSPPICTCGNPLHVRVVGVGQRWAGEPVIAASCLHCE